MAPALAFLCLLLVSCNTGSPSTPTPQESAALGKEAFGSVHVASTPPGATIYLNDAAQGETPKVLTVQPGQHKMRLEKSGYAPLAVGIIVNAGRELLVAETLRDNDPPRVTLAAIAPSVGLDDGLKISATATDTVGVVRMALSVDGQIQAEASEPSLRYNLDTRALGPGEHQLVVEAQDAAGNVGREQAAFAILAPTTESQPPTRSGVSPTATPTHDVPATPSATATATPPPPPQATSTPKPTATVAIKSVSVAWGEVTINTYAYEQALYTDPAHAGHPYPLLNRDRIGPPRPRTYKVLLMRNEYLELTLMPELGGRIYQCRFLPTGQDLFYNNRVIKPSHWGPPEQGWWLAVGGMEFCLPVAEHGYVTAEPWTPEVVHHQDGSATVTMRIEEQSRHIEARVEITLRPKEGGFSLRTTLHNPNLEARTLQYWINAMLSPGSPGIQPSLRFYYPTSQVIVHSRGDSSLPDAGAAMSWPDYGGRDLSHYATWRDWLGFFAPSLKQPFTAVYDDVTQLGIVRVFPPDVARGVKLFGFGLGFGDSRAYTDDGTQYIEMWGGWTPTFWDDAVLQPQASLSWEETWYVLSRCGGPALATTDASLSMSREGQQLDLTIASPGEHRWVLLVAQGSREVTRQGFAVRPDVPFHARVTLESASAAEQVTISLLDAAGNLVLSMHAPD